MMGLENDIEVIRIILSLSMLGCATYWDLKNREISDFLWMIFGAAAVVLVFTSNDLINLLTNVGISLIVAPLAIVVWRLGFFGGADAFGLIVLAGLSPEISLSSGFVTPFTTLINSVLLSAIPIIVNISRNLISLARHKNIFEGLESESRRNKIMASFIGHRSKNPKFSFSIEKQNGSSKKFDFSLKNADGAEFCSSSNTWVTPAIPYMVYITSGFLVQLTYGDIIFNSFRSIH